MKQPMTQGLTRSFLAAALLLPAAFLAATLTARSGSPPGQMGAMSTQMAYFRAHNFDFGANFRRYHPGPAWILQHAQQFNLTASQKTGEAMLKMGMISTTMTDTQKLQEAYKRYAQDSSAADPARSTIHADINAVGKAQTTLAFEMVPYHLKGYALLTPAQQTLYHTLVAAPAPHS